MTQQNLGYLLAKAARLTKWKLNEQLARLGLTAAQWGLLQDVYYSSQHNQELTPAAIAERLFSDRPTVSGVIQRLVDSGWLVKQPNPCDRRSQTVMLTHKAHDKISELQQLSDHILQQALKDFSAEEQRMLDKFLQRIIENVQTS